jgi:flavodoxin
VKKTLVAYFSRTGNTRKIAEAIHQALPGAKEIQTLDRVEGLDDYKLIFIGFPVHSHNVPYKVELFLKKIPKGQKIALFTTHGSLAGGRLAQEALEHALVLASQARVIGSFSCRGKVSLEALEVLKKSPEHEAWADMAASAVTHPDPSDLEDARSFALWVATLSDHSPSA